jgi:hypothetical protein
VVVIGDGEKVIAVVGVPLLISLNRSSQADTQSVPAFIGALVGALVGANLRVRPGNKNRTPVSVRSSETGNTLAFLPSAAKLSRSGRNEMVVVSPERRVPSGVEVASARTNLPTDERRS